MIVDLESSVGFLERLRRYQGSLPNSWDVGSVTTNPGELVFSIKSNLDCNRWVQRIQFSGICSKTSNYE